MAEDKQPSRNQDRGAPQTAGTTGMTAAEGTERRAIRRGQNDTSKLMEGLVKPTLYKHGISDVRLVRDWPLIVGELLANVCMPEGVRFPPGKRVNGVLTIRTAPGWGLHLEHLRPTILEKIAIFFGYKAIEKIQVVQDAHLLKWLKEAPVQAPPLTEAQKLQLQEWVSVVTQPALREQLYRLGERILREHTLRDRE